MKPNAIRAVIFDLGGVLLDWNPRHLYRSYFENPEEMEAFLIEVDFPAWNAQLDGGQSFAEGVSELSSRFPHREALIRAYREHWEESIKGPIPGTLRILFALKESGFPIYGLSNWSAETFPLARSQYDFLGALDLILLSGDAHINKPDPRIFELILAQIGEDADECLFIDDGVANIQAADALGFHTIRFQSAAQLERELIDMKLLKPSGKDGNGQ